MNSARNINEVIFQLDELINWATANNNRLGYFAALYKRMTVAVKDGIVNNLFEDGPRMEKLDVIFANRYLHAWDAYSNNRPCSPAWQAAFETFEHPKPIVLQHLLIGINVHINLDLCIAAVETCPGDEINSLKNDFDKINEVISLQARAVQESLSKIWFPLRLLSKVSQHKENAVLNFSIGTARKCSWANALLLAQLPANNQQQIGAINNMVKELGKGIARPGIFISFFLKIVRMMEDKVVGNNIKLLKE